MLADTRLVAMDRPELYVYNYHGRNLRNRAHWDANLLPFAQPLTRDESERVRFLLAPERE
jgi:hypothetical protein